MIIVSHVDNKGCREHAVTLGYREVVIRDRFHLQQNRMPCLVEIFPFQNGVHAIRYKINGDLIGYEPLNIPDKKELDRKSTRLNSSHRT